MTEEDGEFQHGAFAIKTIRAPDENACTAGYISKRYFLSHTW